MVWWAGLAAAPDGDEGADGGAVAGGVELEGRAAVLDPDPGAGQEALHRELGSRELGLDEVHDLRGPVLAAGGEADGGAGLALEHGAEEQGRERVVVGHVSKLTRP